MIVGLVGEAPNDTQSIKNLLEKNFHECDFKFLLNNITGSQLDEQKTKHLLRKEYRFEKPDIVIFIRDLDALENNAKQIEIRKQYFRDFNSVVDKKGVYLLNIFEIEALILADVDCFNRIYKSNISGIVDPMNVEQPKEFLKLKTRRAAKQFNESHNPEIFNLLEYKVVKKHCRYFNDFIKKLDSEIVALK